jgi:hypothetical protein
LRVGAEFSLPREAGALARLRGAASRAALILIEARLVGFEARKTYGTVAIPILGTLAVVIATLFALGIAAVRLDA